MAKAASIYNDLKKRFPEDAELKGSDSLIDFARMRLVNELKDIGINDAREVITLMLQEAYYRYAVRDDDEAFGREKMAREIYDYYQVKYAGEGVDRVVLPDFDVFRYIGMTMFLNDAQYPEYLRQSLLGRMQVERPELLERLKKQHEFIMQEMEKQESPQQ